MINQENIKEEAKIESQVVQAKVEMKEKEKQKEIPNKGLKTKEILLDKGENFEKKNVRRLYRDVKKILDRLAEAYKIYGSDKS